MIPPLYYIVKAKLVKHEMENNMVFEEYQKDFKNESPIISRQQAFSYYESCIDVLLENKGKEFVSDGQAREELISFIEPGETSKVKIGENEVMFTSESVGNGIGVYLVVTKPISFYNFASVEQGDVVLIHGIGNFVDRYQIDEFMCFLRSEAECYKQMKLDIDNQIIDVKYCMRSAWEDGCEDISIDTYQILKTPFDWQGLDKPYWWGLPPELPNQELEQLPTNFLDIINRGESNTVEFKPTLLYHFKTEKAGISIKEIIAKAICAFLNSNGGFLFIGVGDDGKIQGLDNDFSLSNGKSANDFFLLEFDQVIQHFLGFATKSNIDGKLTEIDGKIIFVVIVQPSSRPVFLKGQYNKKFFVRGEASSRQLIEIEEIINYCIDRFGGK